MRRLPDWIPHNRDAAGRDGEPLRLNIRMKVTCEACPLQIEGTIDGVPFYFRARGESWSIGIGGNDPVDAPQWHKCERWGDGRYAAGWMKEEEGRNIVEACALQWLSEQTK